jgi:hypothetical protein
MESWHNASKEVVKMIRGWAVLGLADGQYLTEDDSGGYCFAPTTSRGREYVLSSAKTYRTRADALVAAGVDVASIGHEAGGYTVSRHGAGYVDASIVHRTRECALAWAADHGYEYYTDARGIAREIP